MGAGIRGFLCLALLLLGLSTMAGAGAAPLPLDERAEPLDPRPHIEVLRDPGRRLSLDDLLTDPPPFASAASRPDLNFGYSHDAFWLRLEVRSTAKRDGEWRLEFTYPSLDRVDLYMPGVEGLVHQQGGDTLPYRSRSIGHREAVFAVPLKAGEQCTLYVRVVSEGSLTLDARLWRADAFQRHSEAGYATLACYFGMLLALAAYNLLLFLSLREPTFILYVGFVCAFGIGTLSLNGLGGQYLWPDAVGWSNRALPFGLTLASAVSVLFARAFLGTARHAPRWHRVLTVAAALELAITVATLLLPVQLALKCMSITGLTSTLLLLGCGLGCVISRVPGARIFVLAWGMLLLGAVLLALRNFDLLPTTFLTTNAMQIGSALEMLLLSFGLAARFNELKRQKEQAQVQALAAQQQVVWALREQERILERRVTERTEALADANERLRALALKDPLTGLANRAALKQQLDLALRRAQRRQEPLALMLIDLDGFKPINDRYGHEVGDTILREVAERLRFCARETDLPARLGGDEFVLVCESVKNRQDARVLAQRVLETLNRPSEAVPGQLCVGASIGVSIAQGDDIGGGALIRAADLAMYRAKASGSNRICLADETESPLDDHPR